MAIPKLIAIDEVSGVIIGQWGPRPSEATKMVALTKLPMVALAQSLKKTCKFGIPKIKAKILLRILQRY